MSEQNPVPRDSEVSVTGGQDLRTASASCPLKASISVFVPEHLFGGGMRFPLKVKAQVTGGPGPLDVEGGSCKFPEVVPDCDHTVTVDLGDYAADYLWDDADRPTKAITHRVGKGEDKLFYFKAWRRPAIEITVRRLDGGVMAPEAHITVVAVPAAGDPVKVVSAEVTGVAVLPRLAPGVYDVSVEFTVEQARKYLPPRPQQVRLRHGETLKLTMDVPTKGTLEVEVVRGDGQPLSQPVGVKLQGPETRIANAEQVTGKASFEHMSPGDYALILTPGGTETGLRINRSIPAGTGAKVTVPPERSVSAQFVLDPPYREVQFIAYYIHTGEHRGTDDPTRFGGDAGAAAIHDITNRAQIMRSAVLSAYMAKEASIADAHVLKVFMAPEFYFRGKQGAYPIETISRILEELGQETGQNDYDDWLFVFGSALGYMERTRERREHKALITNLLALTYVPVQCATGSAAAGVAAGWVLRVTVGTTTTRYEITEVISTARSNTDVYLRLKIGVAIQFPRTATLEVWEDTRFWPAHGNVTLTGKYKGTVVEIKPLGPAFTVAKGWYVQAPSGVEGSIESAGLVRGELRILVHVPVNESLSANWGVVLVDPGETEIFNLALVQKGGPEAPVGADGNVLKDLLVYKEFISQVDFKGPDYAAQEFYDEWRHLIEIHGDKLRRVAPTEGSTDRLAAKPQPLVKPGTMGEPRVSEINRTGVGGGSVFTIDGITFGLEVCLDHGKKRLQRYYTGGFAAPGEPKVQIQLIPSCGMSIKHPCCVSGGLIFNVDAGHVALKKSGGAVSVKPVEITHVGAPGGIDMDDYFNVAETRALVSSRPSDSGYIVVYPPLPIPPAANV